MKISDLTRAIESFAPLAYQESYDNAGLQIGEPSSEVKGALLTLDITESIIDEAIALGAGIVISHHPLVFSGLKSITGRNYIERCVLKAIRNNIAIYSAHTNIDSVHNGVNKKICDKIGLSSCRILQPVQNKLAKLVTFVPTEHTDTVRKAIFDAGAGTIGEYDNCSFSVKGEGTFRAGDAADPFVGEVGADHIEKEIRVETIFPRRMKGKVVSALLKSHPYEEVAYDVYALENSLGNVGAGMIGELKETISEKTLLELLKKTFGTGTIKHTAFLNKQVKRIAVCGGAGSFLLKDAMRQGADVFVSGDFKYHQFFDAENKIMIADIGHFESEQFTIELFYDILTEKFPKFAVHLSKINTNPINYF